MHGQPPQPNDADHITAINGDYVVLNCNVDFPDGQPVPFVVQWWKKGKDAPIYIWYDEYPTHSDPEYEGRVYRVNPDLPHYGLASLNITNINFV